MDYKAMWESLRDLLQEDLEFYKDGSQCSMLEAIDGVGHVGYVLNKMDTIESKYRTKDTSVVYEIEQQKNLFVKPGVPTYKIINAP